MNAAVGFSERWQAVIAEDLNREFADRPSSAERLSEMARLIIANIEAAGCDEWPPIDDPCHEEFLKARVDKGEGTRRRRVAPASGTIRSRRSGLRRTYEAAERCGAAIPEPLAVSLPDDPADMASVATAWKPRSGFDGDSELLAAVRPLVEECVLACGPEDAAACRQLMLSVARFAVWHERETGRIVTKADFTEANANRWIKALHMPPGGGPSGHRPSPLSSASCRSALSLLRRVAQAVNLAGWPDNTANLEAGHAPQPYSDAEQYAFQRAISRARQSDPAARWSVGALSLGGGLSGPEITAATVESVRTVDDGLIVEVGGKNPRQVPILKRYAPLLSQAVDAAESGPFIISRSQSPANGIAASIEVDRAGLSLPRARSTWLVAHLTGGTPLDVLRVIAGPVGANRLTELMEHAAGRIDPSEAAERVLGL